jgi:hypothetical protein
VGESKKGFLMERMTMSTTANTNAYPVVVKHSAPIGTSTKDSRDEYHHDLPGNPERIDAGSPLVVRG